MNRAYVKKFQGNGIIRTFFCTQENIKVGSEVIAQITGDRFVQGEVERILRKDVYMVNNVPCFKPYRIIGRIIDENIQEDVFDVLN